MGQRLLKQEAEPPREARLKNERRSGRRVPLPLKVRIMVNDGYARDARIRDVNLPGLSLEPADGVAVGDRVHVGFEGYPEVAPAFSITGNVKRLVPGGEGDTATTAAGIEIDREGTSADALKNYRRLVLHYLHHRPLLDGMNTGYFEGRCTSCGWIGRVGRRNPSCSRCGTEVVPV